VPAARAAPRRARARLPHRIRQHTSAYVSIRQHTSAYVSIRQHTSAYVSIRHVRASSASPAYVKRALDYGKRSL
jgi:hypothetical protein